MEKTKRKREKKTQPKTHFVVVGVISANSRYGYNMSTYSKYIPICSISCTYIIEREKNILVFVHRTGTEHSKCLPCM